METAVTRFPSARRLHTLKSLEEPLLRRCKEGDPEAFRALVEQYQARIFGFARKMLPSLEDAEDVAQEVFIRAFQNIHRFDHQASLTTWLFRITVNLCIDRLRRGKKTPEPYRLDHLETCACDEPSDRRYDPEDYIFTREMQRALAQTLEHLSPKLKTVLLLHDGEGLNHQQISEILNIPVGTVKSRLFLARAKLQEALKPFL